MAKLAGRDESVVESLDESLEVLQPEEQIVDIGGERVYVSPYTFGKLPKVLKILGRVQVALDSIQSGEGLNEVQILQALGEHGDDVIALIGLSTDYPVEYFDTIPSDKGLELAIMVYKVNQSFFVQNVMPMIQELFPSDSQSQEEEAPKTTAKAKKIGSTSSKS
jgi:hypothetical protein